MKKYKISEIIEELGLPENTEWLGYSIHSIDNDDFLFHYEVNEDVENMAWTGFPDQAKHFQSLKKAEKVRDKFKPEAEVVWVFDIGRQVIVTQPEGYGSLPKHPIH
jgi:hypothetical protein